MNAKFQFWSYFDNLSAKIDSALIQRIEVDGESFARLVLVFVDSHGSGYSGAGSLYCSRNTRLRILPLGLRGISSTNTAPLGSL